MFLSWLPDILSHTLSPYDIATITTSIRLVTARHTPQNSLVILPQIPIQILAKMGVVARIPALIRTKTTQPICNCLVDVLWCPQRPMVWYDTPSSSSPPSCPLLSPYWLIQTTTIPSHNQSRTLLPFICVLFHSLHSWRQSHEKTSSWSHYRSRTRASHERPRQLCHVRVTNRGGTRWDMTS